MYGALPVSGGVPVSGMDGWKIMSIPTLEDIEAKPLTTERITSRVLFSPKRGEAPVLILHGNWSSATWWEEVMLGLPSGFWGIAPDQRGYGEADISKKVDARRGARDWADDILALLDHLHIQKAHILGCSLGGYIAWQCLKDFPERMSSLILVNPVSPYGFCGTKDPEGTPCYPDFAGTGGGIKNEELIQRAKERDRSLESESSPRSSMRSLFKPPFIPNREETLLSSVLATHLGEKDLPGDYVPSPHWPFVAPGIWGPLNATSPKCADDIKALYEISEKIPILWIRGSHDQVISNRSTSDIGYLGKLGLISGWPGEDVYPPQPMIRQTRTVLEKYASAGGSYREVVIEGAGHVPFLEKPDAFNSVFHSFLKEVA